MSLGKTYRKNVIHVYFVLFCGGNIDQIYLQTKFQPLKSMATITIYSLK